MFKRVVVETFINYYDRLNRALQYSQLLIYRQKENHQFCHKVTLLNYHLIHIGSLKVHPSGNSVKVKFDCLRFSHFVTVPDCRSRSQESSRERNSEYGSKDNGNETISCVVLDYALFQYILTTTISEDLQLRLHKLQNGATVSALFYLTLPVFTMTLCNRR